MTVVSTKEFNADQEKYFNMALDEQVYVKRGNNMFHLMYSPATEEQVCLEPDEDYRSAITKDELLEGIYAHIDKRCIIKTDNL